MSTLSELDKLKLDILEDVFTQQTEYTMSLAYNNDEDWSVKERVADLVAYIVQTAQEDVQTIVDDYGVDVFSKSIQERMKKYAEGGYNNE